MNTKTKLYLQLHVHSERSHDSSVSIADYVKEIEKKLKNADLGILAITDHNVIPLTMSEALQASTEKVIVIPGNQWKISKTFRQSISKLVTRRVVLTIGNHNDLPEFIEENTNFQLSETGEILGRLTEEKLLHYLSNNSKIALIIPHPRHFFFDFYGKKEIDQLRKKLIQKNISIPFFVEIATGYDPFPRIFEMYDDYLRVGSSDAHEIKSFLGTDSFFSVESYISCDDEFKNLWQETYQKKDLSLYDQVIENFIELLREKNSEIFIKKYYGRSIIHFLSSVPRFIHRRFTDFPNNLLE